MWLLLGCIGSAKEPTPDVSPHVLPDVSVVTFTCETAAEALGYPGATVAFCKEAAVLRGVYRVRLEGTPTGRMDLAVAVEGGRVVTERGGAAFARFLRRSEMWGEKKVAADELRDALDAFAARPEGFGRDSGPRTLASDGKSVFFDPKALEVVLETARAWTSRGGGVSHPNVRKRATLTGGPTQPLTWTITEQRGKDWVVLETIALEP